MVVTPTAMPGPRKWRFHPSGSQLIHPLSSGHVQVANSYSQMPKRKAGKFATIKSFKKKCKPLAKTYLYAFLFLPCNPSGFGQRSQVSWESSKAAAFRSSLNPSELYHTPQGCDQNWSRSTLPDWLRDASGSDPRDLR